HSRSKHSRWEHEREGGDGFDDERRLPAGRRGGRQMETRPAHFRSAFHIFRRRQRASRSSQTSESEKGHFVRPQKLQRSSHLLRQPTREIRSRIDGFVIFPE